MGASNAQNVVDADAAVVIVVIVVTVVTVASVTVANEAKEDEVDVVAAVAGADISATGPLLLSTSMTRRPSLHYLEGLSAWWEIDTHTQIRNSDVENSVLSFICGSLPIMRTSSKMFVFHLLFSCS